MKYSTIKKVLHKKVKNWLASIPDEAFREHIADNVFVSGGAITSMLMGEKPNDYDLYFKDQQTAFAVAEYYCDIFDITNSVNKSAKKPMAVIENVENIRGEIEERVKIYVKSDGVVSEEQQDSDDVSIEVNVELDMEEAEEAVKKLKEIRPYRPVFISDNAITLKNKVQLIIRFYGTPEEVHKNFDYAHTKAFYDYRWNSLNVPYETLRSIQSKTLVYNGSLYPVASLLRQRKFINRGWRISADQVLKMLFELNHVDLTDLPTLREQLTGVDLAYMQQFIQALQKEDTPKELDTFYLSKLLDTIFEDN